MGKRGSSNQTCLLRGWGGGGPLSQALVPWALPPLHSLSDTLSNYLL